MARRRDGMTVRSCGCITYEYGPPHICEKHRRKQQERDEKGLRRAVREQATDRLHDLTDFSEYESYQGKWTAYCRRCGAMVIVYDKPPMRGDQINARRVLEEDCRGGMTTW